MKKTDIILVDDDRTMLFLLETQLKRTFPELSYKSFSQPELAIEYIKENIDELQDTRILLDLNMPVLDGFQFLDIMDTFVHKMPVLVVTSSTYHEDRENVMKHPYVIDYITKPITGVEIKSAFEKIKK